MCTVAGVLRVIGEPKIQGVAQLGRAPLLGSGGFFAGSNPVALTIDYQ